METKGGKKILFYSVLGILGCYFLFLGLAKAKVFLAPFLTAVILALVVLPLCRKLERNGTKRAVSSLINTFFLFILSIGFVALLSLQMKSMVNDWPKIKETMKPKIEQLKTFVVHNTPISREKLELNKNSSLISPASGQGTQAVSFLSKIISFFGTYLLVFIYIFFLLNYRQRFKEFLVRLFPDEKREKVKKVTHKSATVVQNYLVGKLILIGLLAVVYSIGLGISGVSNFILVSIIAALFTLIPYIGNIIGLVLAMAFGYLTSGEISVLIGVILTFTVSQFLESYILQPYVVGDKVDLHPFFVILVVVIGNAVWGIIGMILAIPVTAILTIILLHVTPLHPFGFLLSKKST
jgi:predicted PurR-regulated permease PerM